ncbi:uncharacterized protein [Physcomitrium patens]|uniref:C3H1-type domain-containing protein n=1 Tax=Physcomitrium patens TaxID=3218 RepID=A0A7I3ZR10_PHYPA|nr:zinc finger CCCH domain-containing protein 30-like [Physcomitrium patens]|eukprot:XP_024376481.1 zinc finger CCCH domain-containing protein 30-like [Physcomitrella patens]
MLAVLQRQQERQFIGGGVESAFMSGGAGGLSSLEGGVSSHESMVDYVPMSQHMQTQHAMRRLNSFSPSVSKEGEGAMNGVSPQVFQRSQSFGGGGGGATVHSHAFNNLFSSPPSSPVSKGECLGLSLLEEESLMEVGGGKASFFEEVGKGGGRAELRGLSLAPGSPLGGGGSSMGSPTFSDALFNKFLPSNNEDEEAWPAVDMYGCDQFRMFEFKVRRCMRGRSHDWTECPFAHPGEKARRRDPRRFHYSGTACPDFRKGSCRRGDMCEFAHGVFECWLHPARYRTQPCKDGRNCRRRVCFFAHTPEQLRLLPAAAQAATTAARNGGSYDGSPRASVAASYDGAFAYEGVSYDGASVGLVGSALSHFSGYSSSGHSGAGCVASQNSSPRSTLVGHAQYPAPLSPPLSPSGSPPLSPGSPEEWAGSGGAFASLSMSGMSGAQSAMSLQASLQQAAQVRSLGGHAQPCTVPAHRRHLDRLNSMPTLSIPSAGEHRGVHSGGHLGVHPGSAPSSPSGVAQKSMMELIATLQQLEVRGAPPGSAAQWLQQQYTTGPSPLRRCSQSVPGTPTKVSARWEQKERWEVDENDEGEPTVQRVESGRDLRAKIYGRLGRSSLKDAGPAMGDSPDLDWVNDLVKEEPEQSAAW